MLTVQNRLRGEQKLLLNLTPCKIILYILYMQILCILTSVTFTMYFYHVRQWGIEIGMYIIPVPRGVTWGWSRLFSAPLTAPTVDPQLRFSPSPFCLSLFFKSSSLLFPSQHLHIEIELNHNILSACSHY